MVSKFRLLLVSLLVFYSADVRAISIDELNGDLDVGTNNNGVDATGGGATSTAIGLNRTVRVSKTNAGGGYARVLVSGGLGNHSQDAQVTGTSLFIWDGDSTNGLNPAGLGGIDLTQDSGNSIKLEVLAYDYPNGKPISFVMTAYDASDPNGNKQSSATFTLNAQVNQPTIIEFPYAGFVQTGVDGPASFTNIGAITLLVDGKLVVGADLVLEAVYTNGQCRIVPNQNKRVIDACGVCGGDGTSCLDCKGTPNGNAKVDRCGVCAGDGQSCISCRNIDLMGTLATMDATAKRQEKVVRRILEAIGKIAKDASTKAYIEATKQEAHRLQIRNWVLSWTIPHPATVCDSSPFCVSTTNITVLDEYHTHAKALFNISKKAINKLKKLKKNSAAGRLYLKDAQKYFDIAMATSNTVPTTNYSCS